MENKIPVVRDRIVTVVTARSSSELASPMGQRKLKEDLVSTLHKDFQGQPCGHLFFRLLSRIVACKMKYLKLTVIGVLAVGAVLVVTAPTWALDLAIDTGSHGTGPLELATLLTLITLAPALLIMLTSFTRIVIVLSCYVRRWVCSRRRLT